MSAPKSNHENHKVLSHTLKCCFELNTSSRRKNLAVLTPSLSLSLPSNYHSKHVREKHMLANLSGILVWSSNIP